MSRNCEPDDVSEFTDHENLGVTHIGLLHRNCGIGTLLTTLHGYTRVRQSASKPIVSIDAGFLASAHHHRARSVASPDCCSASTVAVDNDR